MNETIGTSPKKVAATITAYIAPIVVGFIATKLGVDVDASTAATFLGPLVLAGITWFTVHWAPPGLTTAELSSDELLKASGDPSAKEIFQADEDDE